MQTKIDLNERLFSTPPDNQERFQSTNMKKITTSASFSINSLKTLGDLLQEKKQGKETPDLRYLVDTSGTAWFARETRDNEPKAPAHYKMTGERSNAARCKTAGNIFFNEDYSVLLKINHKSGDFRPSFESIKWLLAILVVNEKALPFDLPKVLTIEELNYNGGLVAAHECPITKIKSWVDSFKDQHGLMRQLESQNSDTKTVIYENEHGTKRSQRDNKRSQQKISESGTFKVRKILFAADSLSESSSELTETSVANSLSFEDSLGFTKPSIANPPTLNLNFFSPLFRKAPSTSTQPEESKSPSTPTNH